jgi:hypothetical protein
MFKYSILITSAFVSLSILNASQMNPHSNNNNSNLNYQTIELNGNGSTNSNKRKSSTNLTDHQSKKICKNDGFAAPTNTPMPSIINSTPFFQTQNLTNYLSSINFFTNLFATNNNNALLNNNQNQLINTINQIFSSTPMNSPNLDSFHPSNAPLNPTPINTLVTNTQSPLIAQPNINVNNNFQFEFNFHPTILPHNEIQNSNKIGINNVHANDFINQMITLPPSINKPIALRHGLTPNQSVSLLTMKNDNNDNNDNDCNLLAKLHKLPYSNEYRQFSGPNSSNASSTASRPLNSNDQSSLK